MVRAQTAVPTQAVPADSTRLVDGVDLLTFQTIQDLIVEAGANDPQIAIIDSQIEMLREQKADLCFKAVAKAHPELTGKLKIMQGKQVERLSIEKSIARDAKIAAKKKG